MSPLIESNNNDYSKNPKTDYDYQLKQNLRILQLDP